MEKKRNIITDKTIGIVIPIYNTGEYIRTCIDSLLNNTYTDFLIVCVDDGSNDITPSILNYYKEVDNRIHIIEQQNAGVCAARNRGLEYVLKKGIKYVGFIDSDDWVHPQYLEILFAGIIRNFADVSVCNLERVREYKKMGGGY